MHISICFNILLYLQVQIYSWFKQYLFHINQLEYNTL